MAIYRLIKNGCFVPEQTAAMVAAYEEALVRLGIVDRSDPRTETIAVRIVHSVGSGEADIERIVRFAVRDHSGPKRIPA